MKPPDSHCTHAATDTQDSSRQSISDCAHRKGIPVAFWYVCMLSGEQWKGPNTLLVHVLVGPFQNPFQGMYLTSVLLSLSQDFYAKECWAHHPKPYADYVEFKIKEHDTIEAEHKKAIRV